MFIKECPILQGIDLLLKWKKEISMANYIVYIYIYIYAGTDQIVK